MGPGFAKRYYAPHRIRDTITRYPSHRFFAATTDTAFDKIPPLRTDDLLVDRLFQAIQPRLGHAQLYLVALVLPLQRLAGVLTGGPL